MILPFSPVFQKLQIILQIRREYFPLVVFKNKSTGKNQGGFVFFFFGLFLRFSLINKYLSMYI